MIGGLPLLLALSTPWMVTIGVVAVLFVGLLIILLFSYGNLWIQAISSRANVSLFSLVGMTFRQVNTRVIVRAKIMAVQAGIGTERETGITTRRLEAHYLAGGNVTNVIRAIIAAHRADIDLNFDRAAAIDLAGRDVLEAVQTSV
ncbi:MAG: flotillin-like FloA family protein, partial [Pirellulales bacterium]|nr:flotillin-like FloA family protein [Pirellulales bacterium]